MGGMQALQWIVEYPGFAKNAIIIAATAKHSVQTLAFNEAGRCSIRGDLAWEKGNYLKGAGPRKGLSVARMMAHITYLSDVGMEEKFGEIVDWTLLKNLNLVFRAILITKEKIC